MEKTKTIITFGFIFLLLGVWTLNTAGLVKEQNMMINVNALDVEDAKVTPIKFSELSAYPQIKLENLKDGDVIVISKQSVFFGEILFQVPKNHTSVFGATANTMNQLVLHNDLTFRRLSLNNNESAIIVFDNGQTNKSNEQRKADSNVVKYKFGDLSEPLKFGSHSAISAPNY